MFGKKKLEEQVRDLSEKLEKITYETRWLSDFILPFSVERHIVKYDSYGRIVFEKTMMDTSQPPNITNMAMK